MTRARSECERCGRWCGEGAWAEFHHRNPRGMGGTSGVRAAWLEAPSNCLLLCYRCHRWAEGNRAAALAAGWLVSHEVDPAGVPAEVYRRGLVLLGVEYGRVVPLSSRPDPVSGRLRVEW